MGKIKSYTMSAVIIAILFGSHCTLAKEARKSYLSQQVRKVAIEEIDNTGTPSIQIAIGLGADLVYEGAFGLADIENRVKATPASKYRTASVAKWFTATAAMRLSNDEVIGLDEPIQTYCPQYPQKK